LFLIIFDSNNYIVNHYNIINTYKNYKIKIIYTRKLLELVQIFYKIGLINNYFILKPLSFSKKLHIIFSVFFYKNTVFFKNIKLLSTVSKKHYITYRGLKLLNFYIKNSVIIISTSQGLLTHKTALKNKIGGLLLILII